MEMKSNNLFTFEIFIIMIVTYYVNYCNQIIKHKVVVLKLIQDHHVIEYLCTLIYLLIIINISFSIGIYVRMIFSSFQDTY